MAATYETSFEAASCLIAAKALLQRCSKIPGNVGHFGCARRKSIGCKYGTYGVHYEFGKLILRT